MTTMPTIEELGGFAYDQNGVIPAKKKIIICSSPRTGSNNLARLMYVSGLGIPLEYFHNLVIQPYYERISGSKYTDEKETIEIYLKLIQIKRNFNGIFSTKLQYWQFVNMVKFGISKNIFKDAFVLYLYRPDIVGQAISHATAMKSGIWYDHDGDRPREDVSVDIDDYKLSLQFLVGEDSGFRKFFGLAGINPVFITTEEMKDHPVETIEKISKATGCSADLSAVSAYTNLLQPYQPLRNKKIDFRSQISEKIDAYDLIFNEIKYSKN